MAKIIDFNAAKAKIGSNSCSSVRRGNCEPKTPEDVRKFMLGIEEPDEDLHINITFLPLDDERTALIGDFADVRPLIFELGEITECPCVIDPKGKKRGAGIIITVMQAMRLVNMLEEDGWEMNPDVRRVSQLRFDNLYTKRILY